MNCVNPAIMVQLHLLPPRWVTLYLYLNSCLASNTGDCAAALMGSHPVSSKKRQRISFPQNPCYFLIFSQLWRISDDALLNLMLPVSTPAFGQMLFQEETLVSSWLESGGVIQRYRSVSAVPPRLVHDEISQSSSQLLLRTSEALNRRFAGKTKWATAEHSVSEKTRPASAMNSNHRADRVEKRSDRHVVVAGKQRPESAVNFCLIIKYECPQILGRVFGDVIY